MRWHSEKTEGITFEAGIFTNCTQDHLDFFADMNEYSGCKKKAVSGAAGAFARS